MQLRLNRSVTIGAYSKVTWRWLGFVMTAMLVVIGIIETQVPPGRLSTWLMLGVLVLGYGSIFVWLYRYCTPSKSPQSPCRFRLVGRKGKMTIYELAALEESLDTNLEAKKELHNV